MEHSELVKALVKPPEEIQSTLTVSHIDLIHSIMGITGEAGELLDMVKKTVIYNKEFDRENAVEELGDIEFYMEQFRQRTGITREETIEKNISKLMKRYHSGKFTDQHAQDRADKENV
jgi:NTP pyrophosphatase (non-canonical NTP hydrolase)